jgi:hypothetical protein
LQGVQGLSGEQGVQGPKGDKGEKGDPGLAGPVGPVGSTGPQGVPGVNGVSGWEIIVGVATTKDESLSKLAVANCSTGKKVVGGGYNVLNSDRPSEVVILSSYPVDDDTWQVTGTIDNDDGNTAYSLRAYVICARVF